MHTFKTTDPAGSDMSDTYGLEDLSVYYDAPESPSGMDDNENDNDDKMTEDYEASTPYIDSYHCAADEFIHVPGYQDRFGVGFPYNHVLEDTEETGTELLRILHGQPHQDVADFLASFLRIDDPLQRLWGLSPCVHHVAQHPIGWMACQWKLVDSLIPMLDSPNMSQLINQNLPNDLPETGDMLRLIDCLLLIAVKGNAFRVRQTATGCHPPDDHRIFCLNTASLRAAREKFINGLIDVGANPSVSGFMPIDTLQAIGSPESPQTLFLRPRRYRQRPERYLKMSLRRRGVLQMAAQWASGPFIKRLISGGANPREAFPFIRELPTGLHLDVQKNVTPLHVAAWGVNVEAVEALVAAGADPRAQDAHEQTPLHWAMRTSTWMGETWGPILLPPNRATGRAWYIPQMVVVGALLNASSTDLRVRLDVNAVDDVGATAWHYAAAEGMLGVVAMMVDRGADISKVTGTYRYSLLDLLARATPMEIFDAKLRQHVKLVHQAGWDELLEALIDSGQKGRLRNIVRRWRWERYLDIDKFPGRVAFFQALEEVCEGEVRREVHAIAACVPPGKVFV